MSCVGIAIMEQQQSVPFTYLGTIKVSRGRAGHHIYPTLRLPESLGDTIGKRVEIYAAGDRLIIRPCEYKHKDKNSEADDPEKESATRLYTAKVGRSNRLGPIISFSNQKPK